MERLTNKREADLQRRNYETRLEQGYPRSIPEERFLRLAAYEDTGMEPEQVKDMAENAETRLLTWCESRYGFPVGTVMDLLEAKQEGRLLVPPCKVGDTVWLLQRRCKHAGEQNKPWDSCKQYWNNVYSRKMWGCGGKDNDGNKFECEKEVLTMREILFRGKRIDNGEWVEGFLLEQDNPEYHAYIVKAFKAEMDNRHMDILECNMEEVDPSTVGQYTGLKDKNGERIFEGDIVRVFLRDGVEVGPIVWSDIDVRYKFASPDGTTYSVDRTCVFEKKGGTDNG